MAGLFFAAPIGAVSVVENRAAFEAEKAARLYAQYSFIDSVGIRVGSKLRDRLAPVMGGTPGNAASGVSIGSIMNFQGLPTIDSEGRPLGFCSWDINETANVIDGGTGNVLRYAGASGNAVQLVFAVVSAGRNGVIQTNCADILSRYNSGSTGGLATGDDIVYADVSPEMASSVFRSPLENITELNNLVSPEDGEVRFVSQTNRFYSYNSTTSSWTAVSAYGSLVEDSPTELSFNGQITVQDFIANNTLTVNGLTNLNGNAAIDGNLTVTNGTISGNGSGLTELNASNITSGNLNAARGGTGVDGSSAVNGSLLIGNGSGYSLGNLSAGSGIAVLNGAGTIEVQNTGVLSITGSPDQVIADVSTGAVTLSLPQAIAITSTPEFAGMTLNGGLAGTSAMFSGAVSASRIDVSAGGVTTPNVIVGTGAMPLAQSGAGGNTVLGYQTLLSNTSGSHNTGLGYFADVTSTNLNYAGAIGAYSRVSSSDTLVLGALGANKDVSAVDDQVVIGAAARDDTFTDTKLFVKGTGYIDGDLYVSGQVTSSGENLINLNADNVSSGTLAVARGGTGLDGSAAANGSLLIGNGSGYSLGTLATGTGIEVVNGAGTITINNTGVTSINGTANQVIASASTGAITLSLPQSIAATSAPTFGGLTLTGALSGTAATFSGTVNVASELYVNGQPIVPVTKANIDSALTFADDNATFNYGDNLGLGVNALSGSNVSTGNVAIGANVLANLDSSGGNAYRNTGLGNNALSLNVTGNDNTAVGEAALFSNTTGSFNTASGQAALYSNTTGQLNSAYGQASLFANTTGTSNTAVGQFSLGSNTTGSFNTATGASALASNTTGQKNTAAGQAALYSNTTGFSNSAFGEAALFSNTTGFENSAFGQAGMFANTTGRWNTSVGNAALINNTTGDANSVLGQFAMSSNETGSNNAVFGYLGLNNNISGSYNLALGARSDVGTSALNYAGGVGAYSRVSTSNTLVLGALGANKDGVVSSIDDQVVIGATARDDTYANTKLYVNGNANLNGSLYGVTADFTGNVELATVSQNGENARLGFSEHQANNLGYLRLGVGAMNGGNRPGSTALGRNALRDINTSPPGVYDGFYNTAVGDSALAGLTTGQSNIGIGTYAGYLTNGNANILIGRSAGFNLTSGSNNTVMGFDASGGLTSGSNNTLLGAQTNMTVGNLVFATAIGAQSTVSTSSTVALGRVANDQVVIGSTSRNDTYANTRLYVNGNANIAGTLYAAASSFSGAVEATRYHVSTPGVAVPNVILGTSATMPGPQSGTGGNVMLGVGSGASNTSGAYNDAVGYQALFNNTTGSSNSVSGYRAMYSNTTGGWNVASGDLALWQNTSGRFNVASGHRALNANTVGEFNSAVGHRALQSNTTGSRNSALGYGADVGSGGLSYATAIGALSQVSTSNTVALGRTSTDQVVIGASSRNDSYTNTRLYVNGAAFVNNNLYVANTVNASAGNYSGTVQAYRYNVVSPGLSTANVIIGDGNTMPLTQSGVGGNVIVGRAAGQSNTSGQENLATGGLALNSNTTGSHNAAVGYRALQSNTTGGNNSALGHSANVGSGNLSYATAIGAASNVSTSNTIVLGRTSTDQVVIGASGRNDTYQTNTRLYVNGPSLLNGNTYVPTSQRLYFGQDFENSDSVYFQRNNVAGNQTDLILKLGDDGSSSADHFRVQGTGTFTVRGDGQIFATAGTFSGLTVNGGMTHTGNLTRSGTSTHNGTTTLNGTTFVPTGRRLYFGGTTENSDPIYFERLNPVSDNTDLILRIGDNDGSAGVKDHLYVVGGTGNLTVRGDGQIFYNGAQTHSDRRLKSDIVMNDTDDVLDRLTQLNSYTYRYNTYAKDQRKIGVIAQEVLPLFPEAVITDAKGYYSVDYGSIGVLAAAGVGKLHTRLKSVEGQQMEHIERLDQHQGRIASLEQWREVTQSTLGDMQAAIDSNIVKIADHAARLATNEEQLVKLEEVLAGVQDETEANSEGIKRIDDRWQAAFGVDESANALVVNYEQLRISNLSARELQANSVYAEQLEAQIAKIKMLEVDELKAKKVATGNQQIYVPTGTAVTLFSTEADGHYTVTTSAADGSYATATLVVSGGVAKVITNSSEGIEILSFGNVIQLKSNGKLVKASWLKTG